MHKLLIVDDEEYNRDVLSDALISEDYELLEAANGHEALEIAQDNSPDLILLDIMMPEIDGVETLKRLKSDKRTENIPVIMVTALNTDSQIAVCLDNGAADHVVKPYSGMVVRARVRAAIRQQARSASAAGHAGNQSKTLSVIGVKGGVGTTTVALNVAMSFVTRNKTTILCELRSNMGTALVHLNASPSLNLGLLLGDPSGKIDAQDLADCLVKHPGGLRVLLGPQSVLPGKQEFTPEHVESVIAGLEGSAKHLVLDLPSNICPTTEAALRRSDMVLMVSELEVSSLAAARQMLKGLQSIGIGGSSLGVVITNRARANTGVTLNQAREMLGCTFMGMIPPDPEACTLALKTGSPIVVSQPDSTVAEAFSALAERLTAEQVTGVHF